MGTLCTGCLEGELSWEICKGVREGSRLGQEKKLCKDVDSAEYVAVSLILWGALDCT